MWEPEQLMAELQKEWEEKGIPYTLIVDGEGNIVYKHNGYTDGAEAEVIAKVRELVD